MQDRARFEVAPLDERLEAGDQFAMGTAMLVDPGQSIDVCQQALESHVTSLRWTDHQHPEILTGPRLLWVVFSRYPKRFQHLAAGASVRRQRLAGDLETTTGAVPQPVGEAERGLILRCHAFLPESVSMAIRCCFAV
jgi:hypothetical protein